jgi:hypothetical protein
MRWRSYVAQAGPAFELLLPSGSPAAGTMGRCRHAQLALKVLRPSHRMVTWQGCHKSTICLFQELRKALQHLQGELHSKSQQLHVLEAEKYNEIRTQGQNIQHLSHSLSHKEQLIQVSPRRKQPLSSQMPAQTTSEAHLCPHRTAGDGNIHSE